jgi:hypothetical protein
LRCQFGMSGFCRAITVAEGVFAAGHLGELTQVVPFELVDAVLEETGAVQRRLRKLPSRVGVYFLLALALFPRLGYARVWGKLVAGLGGLTGLHVPVVSEKALRDLRRRWASRRWSGCSRSWPGRSGSLGRREFGTGVGGRWRSMAVSRSGCPTPTGTGTGSGGHVTGRLGRAIRW